MLSDGSAVFMIAALMRARFHDGWACLMRAAIPAVIGHAIEVPELTSASNPVPMPADATLTPGAITSGFGAESGFRGPPDEKLAAALKPVWTMVVGASVTEPPSAASSAAAEPDPTPRNGIVTVCFSPVSGFDVILPSKGG